MIIKICNLPIWFLLNNLKRIHTHEDHWLEGRRLRHGGKWVRQMLPILLFFLFSYIYKEGKRRVCASSGQTTPVPRNRECPLDVILENLMWRRMFQGYFLSGFDRSEMLLVSLHKRWKSPSKVHCSECTPMHPLIQTLAFKAQPEELSNLFCAPSSDMALSILCRFKWADHLVAHMNLDMSSPE